MEYIIDNINNYNEEYYNKLLNIIKTQKKEKILKIQNNKDKYRSILGEILLTRLLKKYGINYDEVNISYNDYGKPYLNKDFYYNISHSDDYVICAISKKEIGIDIEMIRDIDVNVKKVFATNSENLFIDSSSTFFQIFTLKEAYFKCLGTNLKQIKNVEFTYVNNKWKCNYKNVNISSILCDNYVISICERK